MRMVNPGSIFSRNVRKTDWGTLSDELEERMRTASHQVNPDSDLINQRAIFLTDAITESQKDACPSRQIHPGRRTLPWWNDEFNKL